MPTPIPNDWTGEYCCYSVEWPKSKQYLAILRGLIDSAAGGRFYLDDTGDIVTAQEIIRATFDYNFRNEEVLMACNDATAAALNAIAAAIRNQTTTGGGGGCCGGGSAGGGQFPPDPGGVDVDGQNPDVDPPPDGYPDWEAFDQQRCGVATQIREELQDSLANMGLISVSGLSVEAIVELMVIALSLTVTSAGLAAIALLLLTIGSTIICFTALSLVNDNEDELVCALLSGTSSATSRAAFLAKWDAIVDGAAVDPVEGFAMKQLIAYLVSNEVVNRMYTANPSIDYSGYVCNCAEPCLEGAQVAHFYEVVDGGGGTTSFGEDQIEDTSVYTTGSDLDHMPVVRLTDIGKVIEEGDVWSFCFTADPTPWGACFLLKFSDDTEVELEDSGTITDHVALRCYDLSAYAGKTIVSFEWGVNRAGGGEWVINGIGLNCPCTEGESCFTPPGPE